MRAMKTESAAALAQPFVDKRYQTRGLLNNLSRYGTMASAKGPPKTRGRMRCDARNRR
jgi:hypothetical protein